MKEFTNEPPRPYYVKPTRKPILLRLFEHIIVKPLSDDGQGATYRIEVKAAQKSNASKQIVDG